MNAHVGEITPETPPPGQFIASYMEATWRDMGDIPAQDMPEWFQAVAWRELTVLAAPFHHHGIMDDMSFLTDRHFIVPVYGKIWRAMRQCFDDNGEVTPSGVSRLSGVSPRDLLIIAHSANYGPLRLAIPFYAEEMVRSWHAMAVKSTASKAMTAAGDVDVRSIMDAAEAAREAVQRLHGAASCGRAAGVAATALLAAVAARTEAGGPPGATTGLADLDELIGGLKPGTVTVIAGRPGMGKSVLAGSIALQTARAGNGALFLSMELSEEMQTARFLADLCTFYGPPVHYEDINRGTLRADERGRVIRAADEMAHYPLMLSDRTNQTVAEIRGVIKDAGRELRSTGAELRVVVLDYLKFIRASERYAGNRVNEIGEITGALKGAAKELGVAIVLVAQVNRQNEQREDKRPQLSDLRESGDIEQDADVVMFVYRDEYYARRETDEIKKQQRLAHCENRMEVLVEKNRHGRTDTVQVWCKVGASAVRNMSTR